jgi:hypothetical protein
MPMNRQRYPPNWEEVFGMISGSIGLKVHAGAPVRVACIARIWVHVAAWSGTGIQHNVCARIVLTVVPLCHEPSWRDETPLERSQFVENRAQADAPIETEATDESPCTGTVLDSCRTPQEARDAAQRWRQQGRTVQVKRTSGKEAETGRVWPVVATPSTCSSNRQGVMEHESSYAAQHISVLADAL